MVRAFLCFLVSLVAGSAIAITLALGIASVTAAVNKSERGANTLVADTVQRKKGVIFVAGGVGFAVGAGAIVWMFYGPKRPSLDPDEPGETDRSEV